MNQSTLKSVMRLFALAKQFSSNENKNNEVKAIVENYVLEYTGIAEAEDYITIFNYHNLQFDKRERNSKRQSLYSVKSTIIINEVANEVSRVNRIHLALVILDVLTVGGGLLDNSLDFFRTICTTFKFNAEEQSDFLAFYSISPTYTGQNIIVVSQAENQESGKRIIYDKLVQGEVHFLLNRSTNTIIFRILSDGEIFLRDGNIINPKRNYFLPRGSVIENYKIRPLYHSHILAEFTRSHFSAELELVAQNVSHKFADGGTAFYPLSFAIKSGEMIGIMGNSGTGKTTLLNLLAGYIKPTTGSIHLNGKNWFELGAYRNAVLGYIPQDDILKKELTVYQNLYLTARLCFGHLSKIQTARLVLETLDELGLNEIKRLKIGTPEKSIISGGQRKRLNLALELIRKPKVLFIDEPTSGLSSSDSERIIGIIKTQTQQGNMALVNIHQPSSNIFKMFDKIMLLDQGGHAVYFGNPVDAIIYLKAATQKVKANERECYNCGNVNPDQMFEIIEEKKLKADGKISEQRKHSPKDWYNRFIESTAKTIHTTVTSSLPSTSVNVAPPKRQLSLFIIRNFLEMVADKQFLYISLSEAPLLAFMLSYIAKYFGDTINGKEYSFFSNVNIPAFLLMSIIVAMFFGLMVSAERIIRDKNIIRRERAIGLSRSAYLNSKLLSLFVLLSVQVTLYLAISSWMLEIKGVTFGFWVVLMSIAINAGVLGLNLSAGLRTTVAIYITIPILLMPQLLLNGSLIHFDKVHKNIASDERVPWVGGLVVSRWGYEALLVHQYSANKFQRNFMQVDAKESFLQFTQGYLVPEMEQILRAIEHDVEQGQSTVKSSYIAQLSSAAREMGNPPKITQHIAKIPMDFEFCDSLQYELDMVRRYISQQLGVIESHRDMLLDSLAKHHGGTHNLVTLKRAQTNEAITDLVLGRSEKQKLIKTPNAIIRNFEPIYRSPKRKNGVSHFFSATKRLGALQIPTIWFNVLIIWVISGLLYIALYFDCLKRLLHYLKRLG
ncbi:MAG: ATP-binding cassette domain-containing protein [Bacteroidales bacterium]|nr:ATP-binding cassette domain-containing protein [Bacteroidales bacterium]MBN2748033.1 ATP-binding cassette domain-containing protein [Bacteroidales bacterium]